MQFAYNYLKHRLIAKHDERNPHFLSSMKSLKSLKQLSEASVLRTAAQQAFSKLGASKIATQATRRWVLWNCSAYWRLSAQI
jgi:hypothetical protein